MKFGSQSMVKPVTSVLLKRPEDAFRSQEYLDEHYKAYGFLESPNMEKAIKEYNEFEKIIKDNVPELYYLPFDERAGLDSVFTHDSVKITNKGAIYLNMGKVLRRGEPPSAQAYLESIGMPTLGVIQGEGRIEGGDIVWLDERTVAIGRSYRTNDEGIRQFTEILGDLVDKVITVPLPHADGEENILHLMSLLSLLDTNLAAVYSRYMPIFFRQHLINLGYTLIETDEKEYDYLGTNVLSLGNKKCVVLDGNPKMKKSLEDAGLTVFAYPGRDLSYFTTGGATCMTCILAVE